MRKLRKQLKKKRKKKAKRISLPHGALDTARLRFLGQTLNWFYETGFTKWVKVQDDGSLKLKRTDGTFGEVPLIVCCTRDRKFAYEFVKAMCSNTVIPDGVFWRRDHIDKELNRIISVWEKQREENNGNQDT